MGKPYPLEFRKRVVAAIERGGLSCNQAAKQFGIGISTAIGWGKRVRETGADRARRIVLQPGGQAIRDRDQHSDRLGEAAAGDWQRCSRSDGRSPSKGDL